MNKLQQYEQYKMIDMVGQVVCFSAPSIIALVLWSKSLVFAALIISCSWQLVSFITNWLVMPKHLEHNSRAMYGLAILVVVIVGVVSYTTLHFESIAFLASIIIIPLLAIWYGYITYNELLTISYNRNIRNLKPLGAKNRLSINSLRVIKLIDLIGQLCCVTIPLVMTYYVKSVEYGFLTVYYVVGGWQLTSFLFNLFLTPKEHKCEARKIYAAVLIAIACILIFSIYTTHIFNVATMLLGLILLAPFLALGYGIITYYELNHIIKYKTYARP